MSIGKISRLPHEVREELNQRLESSEESPALLAWLNAVPEVQQVLKETFGGKPVNKQNLSHRRRHGFQEWLIRQELWEHAHQAGQFREEMDENRDNVLADDVATVMAARYAALLMKWNGEADEKFQATARALNNLCRGVVGLQRSMHQAKQNNDQFIRHLEEENKQQDEEIKQRKVRALLDLTKKPLISQLFGGGELGDKIAKYIWAVQNDLPGAKLDLTGLEKTEEAKSEKAKTPKPAKKKHKPLKEKEISAEQQPASEPVESNSVKLSQASNEATEDFTQSEPGCSEKTGSLTSEIPRSII